MAWLHRHILSQWVFSGVLLGIGFVFPFWWFAGLMGGAYFLYLTQLEQTNKSLYFGAWTAWSIKTAAASVWFWSTYPIDWLPVEFSNAQLLIIGSYWLIASLCMGVGGSLFAFAFNGVKKNIKSGAAILGIIIPIIWVISEVFGSFVFSIVSFGPGGSINAALSFGYSGYLLTENQWLLSFAKVAGVYGLGFTFAVLSLLLLNLVLKKPPKYSVVPVTTLILFMCVNLVLTQNASKNISNTREISVVIIDTNFPVYLFRDNEGVALISNKQREAMRIALQENPDYIILPEDSRFFNQNRSPSVERSFFQLQYDNPSTVIVDTGRVSSDDWAVLQTFIYTGVNKKIEQVQKGYLVPQGEFISTLYTWIFRLIGFKDIINKVDRDVDYRVGTKVSQTELAKEVPGVLFCFESVNPIGVRTLLKERPDLPFVAHPISHSWFHESNILWHQLDTMLKVQAVWNSKYIVSAASHAEGKVITPEGKIQKMGVVAEGEMWRVKKVIITVNPG